MTGSPATSSGIAAIAEFLEDQGVEFQLVEHSPTMSAYAEARATRRFARQVAKTVVLHEDDRYVLAVVPASQRVDLEKLRDVLGASERLRLATEQELAADFPSLEVGATPPIGPLLPLAEIVDARLLMLDSILCSAGDHRHSLLIDPREVVRVADARVSDICDSW